MSDSLKNPANAEGNLTFAKIPAREAIVGDNLRIHRALPSREKRLIGAWCFLDHAGPSILPEGEDFLVGPHPHIGLQTFTWMLEGEMEHHDSLGYHQVIRPYEINLMTAGKGISHVEKSPENHSSRLHTAQLWIALPDSHRHIEPAFDHYENLPSLIQDQCNITVLAGEFLGQQSPVKVYSKLVGIDISATQQTKTQFELNPNFEYGILVLHGSAVIEGEAVQPDELIYLGLNRSTVSLQINNNTRLLLLAGKPFGEDIIMWWNFVARTTEEIQQAAIDWQSSDRFGLIQEFNQHRIVSPPIPDHLRASR